MGDFSLKKLNVPMAILIVVVSLMVIGLIGVYSASSTLAGYEVRLAALREGRQTLSHPGQSYHDAAYLIKQAVWMAIGMMGLIFFYHYDYRNLKKYSFWIMLCCFIMLLMVWLPVIGYTARGATRWIGVGPIRIQPSEFAKLGLIIYMAKMLDDRHHYIKSFFSGVLPAMIVTGIFALIIVIEPDFGAAFVLGSIIFGMWLCGEMSWIHLGGLVFSAAPAIVMALLKPYRRARIMAWINVAFFDADPEILKSGGWQLHQSLIAIGSGGLTGVGLGQSMQKHHYLFAAHTDFIFAILGEELGFVGTTLILMLFAALVLLGWWVALNTSDLFGSLLATGITLLIFLGSSINMCVVLGLLPTKGLVLPFMSYGGSSLIVALCSMGILMNIAKRQFRLSSRSHPSEVL